MLKNLVKNIINRYIYKNNYIPPLAQSQTPDSILMVALSKAKNLEYTLMIDGQEVTIPESEIILAYKNKTAYDIARTTLREERKAAENEMVNSQRAIKNMESFNKDWEQDPIIVLLNLILSTPNPEDTFKELLIQLTSQGFLEEDTLLSLGITSDIEQEWKLTSELNDTLNLVEKLLYELDLYQSMSIFDEELNRLIDSHNLRFSAKERKNFKEEIAHHAAFTGISDLNIVFKDLRRNKVNFKKKFKWEKF